MKFVVVTGGVLSGLGKGVVTSSLAKLFMARGYRVTPIKFDGYLNVDAGTMNPIRHGEVFVLDALAQTTQYSSTTSASKKRSRSQRFTASRNPWPW